MKKRKVKQIFQQFLIAVVLLSLICPGNLRAKIIGAWMELTRLDGEFVEGRLLRVEENSLLIWTTTDRVTINIKEIDKIRITRKSKAVKGALIGLLGGGAACYAIAHFKFGDSEDGWGVFITRVFGVGGALVGLITGTLIGLSAQNYKTYQVKGKSPSQIKKVLKKLKKRARFKD